MLQLYIYLAIKINTPEKSYRYLARPVEDPAPVSHLQHPAELPWVHGPQRSAWLDPKVEMNWALLSFQGTVTHSAVI